MLTTIVHFKAYNRLAKLTFYDKTFEQIHQRLTRIFPNYEPVTIIQGHACIVLESGTPEYRQFLIRSSFKPLHVLNNLKKCA
jgi:hypothetical protein